MLASTLAPPDSPFGCKVAINFKYLDNLWKVSKVEIYQDNGLHQRAIVTVAPPVKTVLPSSNMPITIEYGQQAYDWNTFYGYVNHIEHKPGGKVEIWVIGASAPMRNQQMKVWEKVSASYIANRIAVSNKMQAEIDIHSEILTVVQAGKSDFQFLKELADRIGFRFFIVGTTLYFINPLLPLRDMSSSVMWFWVSADTFQPRIGELVPGAANLTSNSQYALDAETGRIVGGTAQYDKFLAFGESKLPTPLVKRYLTANTASSLKEVVSKLNAEVSGDLHWVTATTKLRNGSARLRPCDVIGIQGGVSDKFQGLWLVDSITQTLTPGFNNWNYSAEVALMRDQIYSTTILPRSGWSASAGLIETRWANGMWVSESIGG